MKTTIYLDTSVINFLFADDSPEKKEITVAFCVVSKIDYLVSWNFKHLANINRERRVLAKNYELGYIHPLRIITPTELTGYGT